MAAAAESFFHTKALTIDINKNRKDTKLIVVHFTIV